MHTNYDKGLEDIKKIANCWLYKYLTIFGKITVVKTYILSKISHIASVLPPPPLKTCKMFDKIILDFIQGTNSEGNIKNSIITETILHAPKSQFGLGPHNTKNFCSALKLPWLKRLSKPSTWRCIHEEKHQIPHSNV